MWKCCTKTTASRLSARFAAGDELACLRVQYPDRIFVVGSLGAPEPFRFFGIQVKSTQKGAVAFRGGAGSGQEEGLAVIGRQQNGAAEFVVNSDKISRVVVPVFE